MDLKSLINEDMKKAMKEKNSLQLSVLRLLKSAIKNEEIARIRELDDEGIISVIQREIKKRKESVEEFKKGNRADLVEKEEAEAGILYQYLPAQASDDEISVVVKEILSTIPDGTKVNMGMVMPKAIEKLKGKADGKRISQVVKKLIGN